MSSPIKDENICDSKESVSSNSGGSEDNRQENLEEQNSEKETNESKTESSDDSDTKSQKSEFFQTEKMDYTDSSAPSGNPFKTKYVDDAAKRFQGNDCHERKITKDPDYSPPNGNLFQTESVADLKTKSTNSETHKIEIYKDSSTEYNSIGCKSLEDLNSTSWEVSEDSRKSQSLENSDNNSPRGTQQSPVAGPSTEPNLIWDDAENSPLTQEIYGPRTNLTDYADVSEATSDGMEPTRRVQRKTKKKQKAVNESENESVEEDLVGNPNLFIPIWNEDSAKEAESTTTDDVRVTPFEDIGLEQNQSIPSPPPSENLASSVEGQDSTNPETPDDGSKSDNSDDQSSEKESENQKTPDKQSSANTLDNPETPDKQSSANKSDNPETPDEQSLTNESNKPETPDNESSTTNKSDTRESPDYESTWNKSSDNRETLEDAFAMDIVSDNIEIFGDQSIASKSDSLVTSESEGNKPYNPESDLEISVIDSKDKPPSNSQKRKLSIIHEEPEEFGQVAKRLRPSESMEEIGDDVTS